MDTGMIRYDEALGWQLTPEWKGRHRHNDFDVAYTINRYGFRCEFMGPPSRTGLTYAVVGDSFTFGLGADDHDTFVHLLNAESQGSNRYLDFSIPGFSTDQQYLLLRKEVLSFIPDVIVLIVYLGNDLFDNELPFPLQAENAKPYYEQTPEGLVLRHSPVPRKRKPPELSRVTLTSIVLGDSGLAGNECIRFLNRSALFRLLGFNPYREENLLDLFEKRFEPKLDLFFAIIDKIRDICAQKDIRLSLVLMPGRSLVQLPHSTSAWYQDHLRKKIVKKGRETSTHVIDLADLLRSGYQTSPGRWFHPNEGHLTADGHRVVAGILRKHLR